MAEDEPPASVSSLRSRFERLASSTDKPPPPETPILPLRPSRTGSDPFSSKSSFETHEEPARYTGDDIPGGTSQRGNTIPRGYTQTERQRPVSVFSTFSPLGSPPTVRVESPHSPPSRLDINNANRAASRTSIETGLVTPSPNSRPPRAHSRPSSRPPSPPPRRKNGKTPPPPPAPRPVSFCSPGEPARPQQPLSPQPKPADTVEGEAMAQNGPPPVPARSTKPKISSRPPLPPKHIRPLPTPELAPMVSPKDRVSPFSTPPSSTNNSPTKTDTQPRVPWPQSQSSMFTSGGSTLLYQTDVEFRSSNRPGGSEGSKSRPLLPPPRLSLDQRLSQPNRDTDDREVSALRNDLTPPRASVDQIRPRMRLEDSVKGHRMSLDDIGRPDLPPRPSGLIGGIKARGFRNRSYSPPRASQDPKHAATFLPPPKRSVVGLRSRSLLERGAEGGSASGASSARNRANDSDEDEYDDDQSGLSDYPDSSQVNRRKPLFKEGPREIPCKSDIKLFAVCGRHVCTISHSTKAWDIDIGRCIMAITHGEGVRVTALAFKPSSNIKEEGAAVWLGTSQGELIEIEIASQRTANVRASAHTKREVVKIHRFGFDLWTIDNAGKLQVWAQDASGSPNLRNSPTTFRIHPRHSCSIVVDGYLWVGSGKTVDVYRPSTNPTTAFNVSQRPLSPQKQIGEITCAATVNSQPDKVYFGHTDGSVSVYSRTALTCLEVVSVSLYKITSMCGVGDYLWAGFKTGMIYVYDIRPKSWRVLKDWHCCDGPVMDVVADKTSIWKNGRLEVVSIGADNIIRTWDGMLQDDWLEAELQKRDIEYCTFRKIRALLCTWNAGAAKPQDLSNREGDRAFLENVLNSVSSPEIIVFGLQELVDLEDKKITAKSFLKGSKKRRAADQQEHMSHQYRLWQQQLTKSISIHKEEEYHLLHAANLVGLFTCIFIKASERGKIRNVSAATVKRGLGGLHGNKGALVVRFLLDDSSLCFVNCHLAAGQSHTVSRNNDIAAILETAVLPPEPSAKARADMFVGGGDGSMILDHEICILNGDLNYRIDLQRDSVIHKIKNNDLAPLLERDQLLSELRKNPGFRLRVFSENQLTFPPTYKYDVGRDEYDTSEKKRAPAWCDRLLYRGLGKDKIEQTDYRRWEVKASDHRPVSGSFLIQLKTINPTLRKHVWQSCLAKYEEVRARHVWDAQMDYLVNVCGYPEDAARRSLAD